jgi:transposase
VACDRGYDFPVVRRWFRRFGVRVVIPRRRPDRRHRPRRGRPFGFDPAAYRRRNAVERCVGWLKESRRVATRYEKLAVSYLAVVHVAMIRLYLKRVCATLSDRT